MVLVKIENIEALVFHIRASELAVSYYFNHLHKV